MTRSRITLVLALAFVAMATLVFPASPARAAMIWDNNGTGADQTNGAGAWLGTGLWWDGSTNVDWVSGSDAIFGGTATAAGAVTLASPTTVESFTFNPSYTGTYTLGTAGQTITLNSGITKNASSAAATIISPISLGGAQTWTNNSTTNLSATGGVNNGGNTLTIDGTGNISFAGTANIITGAGGITKNGTGILYLGASGTTPAHNYSGPTVINGGVVMTQNNLSANSNYTLNNAMFADYYRTNTVFNGLGTGNKEIQIYGASGFGGGNAESKWRIGAQNSVLKWGTVDEGATGFFNPTTLKLRSTADNNGGSNIWGQVTLQNRLDLNSGTRTIDVLLGGTNVNSSWGKIDAGIQDTGAAGSLIKTGGGILIIGGTTSTWGGNTTVSGGILAFDGTSIANIGGGSGRNISVAAGAGIRISALTSAVPGRIVQTNDEISLIGGIAGANNYDLSSTGANLPNAFLGNYSSNGGKVEYTGTITPASDNYRIGTPIGMNGLLGIRSESVMSGTQGLIVGGGSVELVGPKTFSGDTVIRTGARLGLAAIDGAGGVSYGLQNSVLDVGSAGGNFWLESVAGPDARVTGAVATTGAVFGGLKGSRNLSSVYSTTTGANNGKATALAAVTGFTLNVGTGVSVTYSGAIGGFGTGAGTGGAAGTLGNSTLTKTGLGTQILAGTSTYTGATTVDEGTLLVNGSLAAAAGKVTVNANGTLGGTGAIASEVNVFGGLSPGASIGDLDTGNLLIAETGTLDIELGREDVMTVMTPVSDIVNVTGTVTLAIGANLKLTLYLGLDAPEIDDVFYIVANDSDDAVTGVFTKLNGVDTALGQDSTFTWNSQTWKITYTADAGIAFIGGNDVAITVVPEPATLGLLAIGGLALLGRRRRA